MSIVYALLDMDCPGRYEAPLVTYLYKPYYIGKATTTHRIKWHQHESIRNKERGIKMSYKNNKILKYLENHDSIDYCYMDVGAEEFAYEIEAKTVDIFGLSTDGGILTNAMLGGKGGKVNHWTYVDSDGNTLYLHKEDARIDEMGLKPLSHDRVITVYDSQTGEVTNVSKEDYDESRHTLFHLGRKRSEETKLAISSGKKEYVFTEEHLYNMTEANRRIAREVHTGAKRSKHTKEAISKSRVGAKSKVAKTWKFVSPDGTVYIFKGGFGKFCEMMQLSPQRMRNNIGKKVGQPKLQGHINSNVLNTEGWLCDYTDEEPNLSFFFIPKHLEAKMG